MRNTTGCLKITERIKKVRVLDEKESKNVTVKVAKKRQTEINQSKQTLKVRDKPG